ncbi:hypothetical protein CKO11_10155 [Rhodobacter sp. TJ_12]|uniref:hypothetical protein n=1 Tax=Rhodobacter sp. TJ_12 TaxID=2029399 RepID=UPI001CBD747E|nr:hypothetical protein [Rhodobacter sp. TJ_12]MBZ4022822.1 hypothetical protein [Rhodobacter sp. TJ_12]
MPSKAFNRLAAGFVGFALGAPAAWANPAAEAAFATGVDLCLRFGQSAWFATDRFEKVGWRSHYDADYGRAVMISPDGAVIALLPTSDRYPLRCSIVSGQVPYTVAQRSVATALEGLGGAPWKAVEVDGCPAYEGGTADVLVHIRNDGNDDLCNAPDSARVEVIARRNPLAGP